MSSFGKAIDSMQNKPPHLTSSTAEAACLAHDQNNYLQVVFVRLDALRTHLGNDSVGLDCVDRLYQALECLTAVNREVLRAFRASRLATIEDPTILNEAIEGTVELARSINTKDVLIETRLGATGGVVPILELHLQQVIFNLVKNAMEAVPEQGGQIIVESCIKPWQCRDLPQGERNALYIIISDNGPGIPNGIRSALFHGGFTSKGEEGHGLGLYHVRKILGMYGGSVSLQSHRGPGTKAIVVWPFEGIG